MHRRARAKCPDGKLRIVICGIPDTMFTIPVKGGGFLDFEADVVTFHPPKSWIKIDATGVRYLPPRKPENKGIAARALGLPHSRRGPWPV